MKFGKLLVAALVAPSLVTPAIAADAVRPSVKPVAVSAAKQDRSLVVRSSTRAGAKVEGENELFLAAFPLLALAAAAVVAVVVAAVVVAEDDPPASPGS